jgi:Alpha-galactosyl-binding fungal lectin/Subtilase family
MNHDAKKIFKGVKPQLNLFQNLEWLQTQDSIDAGEGRDDSGQGHSTQTAALAAARWFGASKQATLVAVKIGGTRKAVGKLTRGLDAIREHVRTNNRAGKSVVTISFSINKQFDPTIDLDSQLNAGQRALREAFRKLMEDSVIVVVAAGNKARTPGRQSIDTIPALFTSTTDNTMPLIVVGAADKTGQPAALSQTGPQLSIWGPGVAVQVPTNQIGGATTISGTSAGKIPTAFPGIILICIVAAPLVAGVIANFLAYSAVPFPANAAWARNYVMTVAGWPRQPGIRMIWNGVTEANNPRSGSQVAPANAQASCIGLSNKKYVTRNTVNDIISNQFCPDAVKQGALDQGSGSISRTYLKGTTEEVEIAMDWSPDANFKPNLDDCKKWLGVVLDGCDGNDPNNPMNWKSGGSVKADPVNYRIDPKAPRQPAPKKPVGSCHTHYDALFDSVSISGNGWLNSDSGAALKSELEWKCALMAGTFQFSYGLGDDGREWTLSARTGVFQQKCVAAAGRTAGADDSFTCDGTS